MVMGKLPVPGRPANLDYSRAMAPALALGAGRDCLDIFSLFYQFSSFSISLGDDSHIDRNIVSMGRSTNIRTTGTNPYQA